MQLLNENVIALVISSIDNFKNVCVTEYTKDGTWCCGLNIITSPEDVLKTAFEKKLNIIPENLLQEK